MDFNKEEWIRCIDNNLTENLTTGFLASRLNLSETHLKRTFRKYFGMTVSDYVRKRRMHKVAEQIRAGKNHLRTGAKYGYKSHAGLMRAFSKEFLVTPAAYQNGEFETIDVQTGAEDEHSRIQVGIFNILPIKMEAEAVFHAEASKEEQKAASYWKKKGFPSSKVCRIECNVEQRDDKVAFWYPDTAQPGFHYMVGSVVDEFQPEKKDGLLQLKIPAGKYAIFQRESLSDEEDFLEVRKIFRRYVLNQWVKENRERVDGSGMVFERFVNRKMYWYVPVKSK